MQIEQVTVGAPARVGVLSIANRDFHVQMFFASVAVVIVSLAGCWSTSIEVPGAGIVALTATVLLAAVLPLLLYLQERGMLYLQDAILTILWGCFLYCVLNLPVTIAARLGRGIALQDSHFIELDRVMRVNVPAIAAWADKHGLGAFSAKSYFAMIPLLWIAVLLPILLGKVRDTQRFLTANLIAFGVGLPLFALLPAVGPWYGYHLAARPDEAQCQNLLLLIRTQGSYAYHPPAGIICFPSYHVIWAILCGSALWGFQWLRIPVALLVSMIVVSTLTTGVHYFCDVLAGIAVAALAIYTAQWLRRDDCAVPPQRS